MIHNSSVLFTTEEEQAVLRVLRSGQLSQGPEVEAFEQEFAKYIGSSYAVAVSNGTTALHLALIAVGVNPGDEVITTPFSFVASTNAILYVGAKPVFVDIGDDFNIDVSNIEKRITKKTKAILPVHLFGYPCDMDELLSIAKKHHLVVIEDACQAHGATYKGEKVGSMGTVGCFSFYATKNITTGEGGMVVTDDIKIAEHVRRLRTHGSDVRYHPVELGYNDRMTDMQAALGRVQLKRLDELNNKRRENADYYHEQLKSMPGLVLPPRADEKVSAYHQFTLRIRQPFPLTRDELLTHLCKHDIESMVVYPVPIDQIPHVVEIAPAKPLPHAKRSAHEVLSIPIHPHLTENERSTMVHTIRSIR